MIRRGIGVGSFVAAGGGGTDADAQAFITAAAITDATQQSAINTLVVNLKTYGIWTKMKALYPFVGGTATTHKWNLKDPRDLDAAFRLVFYGGITHNANGISGNSTNGYADTFLTESTSLNITSKHISMYQRNVLPSFSNTSMGISDAVSPTNATRFYLNFNNANFSCIGQQQTNLAAVVTPQRGMFILSKITTGQFKYFQNNLTPTIKSGGTDSNINRSFSLLAVNNGSSIAEFSNANLAFASIGDGLTDTEAANFYTAVQAYQTTLSRNV
jgi:hypothetical protein